MSEGRDSEEAYAKVQKMKQICKASISKSQARVALEAAGLWFEWVPTFGPYLRLPA